MQRKSKKRGLSGGAGGSARPALPSTNMVAHYDTSIGSSITIATGVSNLADLSGNGRDLVQAVGAKQPVYNGGSGGVTFDGVDDNLRSIFALTQPETVYFVAKAVSWVTGRYLFDGGANAKMVGWQIGVTPAISTFAGTTSTSSTDMAVGAIAVLGVVFNGASSSLTVDDNAVIVSDAGLLDGAGFAVGSNSTGAGAFSNIILYEAVVYNVAHDAVAQGKIIDYLMRRWDVT